jgi:hypothetical protein
MTPPVVVSQVVQVLSVASGHAPQQIANGDRLFEELGLSTEDKDGLAPPFQRIARDTCADAHVTQQECEGLLTVKGAIDLVTKKATPRPAGAKVARAKSQ